VHDIVISYRTENKLFYYFYYFLLFFYFFICHFWCREEIISQEVARIQPIGRSQQIIQLFTSHPWIRRGEELF
jgi:hypothetical protein